MIRPKLKLISCVGIDPFSGLLLGSFKPGSLDREAVPGLHVGIPPAGHKHVAACGPGVDVYVSNRPRKGCRTLSIFS